RHRARIPGIVVDSRHRRVAGAARDPPLEAVPEGAREALVSILDRYLVRSILAAVAMWMAGLLVLGALLLFIGEQDDIGVGDYTAIEAFKFVLLSLPQQVWELLPIAALIGALTGLGTLARGSEITVIRATGASVARLASAALLAGALLI